MDDGFTAAPWGIEIAASVPAALRQWLIDHWSARIDPSLASLRFARVSCTEPAAEPAPAALKSFDSPDGPIRWWTEPGEPPRWKLYMANEAGGCEATETAGAAEVRCWGTAPQLTLFMTLTEIFRCRGWLSLHASAARLPGESAATVFIGRSGAGKSHRLLECLEAGAQPIAEDQLWLQWPEQRVVARDFSVRTLPETVSRFPNLLADRPYVVDPDGKRRYQLADLGHRPAAPCMLGRIALLASRGEAADADPLTRARLLWEAIGRPLLPASAVRMSHFVQNQIDRITV